MEKTDLEIVQLCQSGELEQFAQLYDKYIDKIYKFIYYRTQHRETAEDLTSQVFIKAVEKLEKFKIKDGYFSAWLYKIARNSVIDYYRTNKNMINIDDVWGLYNKEDFALDIDIKQNLQKVNNYINHLKSDQRDIIVMRLWDQLSYSEIANITSKSEASCKMVYMRAVSKLRADIALAVVFMLINFKIYE